VGGDAVEEPAVVGEITRSGKILQRLFSARKVSTSGRYVGRVVEQQEIGAGFEILARWTLLRFAARVARRLSSAVGAIEIEEEQ